MRTRTIAAVELVLIFPATLFITSVILRHLQPLYPAQLAQQLVAWYAGRMWTLWVLLLALPFSVLITGCATLVRKWGTEIDLPLSIRAHFATVLVAATTVLSAVILAIVVLHMLAN